MEGGCELKIHVWILWFILCYLRVVSSTPDIVKSVEENKAEEADNSENNNDAKQTKGRHRFRAHFC